MERNELSDKFFELKCKQNLLKLWLIAFTKPDYLESKDRLCMNRITIIAKLINVQDEMLELLKANEIFFRSTDLDGYCQEHKISMDKQRELSKEVIGQEYTLEELMEKVERR